MKLLNLVEGWQRRHLADGIVLVPPQGLTAGAVTIKPRVALRPLRAVLDEMLAETHPALRAAARVSPALRFITVEGEYGALATMSADAPDGSKLERVVALVFGDEHAGLIDGLVAKPELAATIREVVWRVAESFYLGLGEQRRRRYLYAPPAGWRGVGGAHVTHWYPPGHPKEPGVIHVFDARAAKLTQAEGVDRLLFLDFSTAVERDPPHPSERVKSSRGLAGSFFRYTGRDRDGQRVILYQCTLMDTRFAYVVQFESLEASPPDAIKPFLAVIDSIHPLPARRDEQQVGGGSLIQWAD